MRFFKEDDLIDDVLCLIRDIKSYKQERARYKKIGSEHLTGYFSGQVNLSIRNLQSLCRKLKSNGITGKIIKEYMKESNYVC